MCSREHVRGTCFLRRWTVKRIRSLKAATLLLAVVAACAALVSCSSSRQVVVKSSGGMAKLIVDCHRTWYIGDGFEGDDFIVYVRGGGEEERRLDTDELVFSIPDGTELEGHTRIYINYKGLSVPFDIYPVEKHIPVLDYLVMQRSKAVDYTKEQILSGAFDSSSMRISAIFQDGSIIENPDGLVIEARLDGDSGFYDVVVSHEDGPEKTVERHGLHYGEGDGILVSNEDNVRVYRNGDDLTVYVDDVLSTRVTGIEIDQNGRKSSLGPVYGGVGGIMRIRLANVIIDGGYDWSIRLEIEDGTVKTASGHADAVTF